MQFEDHWEILKPLGEGGQGKVSLACDRRKFDINKVQEQVGGALRTLSSGYYGKERSQAFDTLRTTMENYLTAREPFNLAALKVLHDPKDAKDPERAGERIRREMKAMSQVSHSNLLCVRDADPDGHWFASEYHPKGALSEQLCMFQGDFPRALKAFRGLVAGVATLHKKGIVHRDIKPQNIFLSETEELVLGDFGLVFFNDGQRTRLSATLENVGTRDWMPPWAMGMMVEDVKPTFDVYSLGKVLWSMVSGKPFLRLWYWNQSDFNLEELFPQAPFIRFARGLLSRCVVEHEKACMPDANELLAEVDEMLQVIERNGDILRDDVQRPCRVCGRGNYVFFPNGMIDNSPFRKPAGGQVLKMFTCDQCGHVQVFLMPDRTLLPAWRDAQ